MVARTQAVVVLATKPPVMPIAQMPYSTAKGAVIQQSTSPATYILLVVVVCAGLAAWLWVRRADRARAQQGRSRLAAWCVALVVVAGMLAATLYSILGRHPIVCGPGELNCPKTGGISMPLWLLLIIPAAVLLVLALKPDLAARIVPAALIALGLLGFFVVRRYGYGLYGPGSGRLALTLMQLSRGTDLAWYGLVGIPSVMLTKIGAVGGLNQGTDAVILAQAYLFVLLGGWLGWRELRDHPAAARLILGKMAAREASGQPWGLLLLPLVLALAVLVAWPWWSVPLLVIAVLVIRSWPRLADQLAAAGMVAFGALGLVAAQGWYLRSIGPLAVVPGSAPKPIGRYVLYGLVTVTSDATRLAAELEGVLLIGFGCWLVPQTFPVVGRLLGLTRAVELTARVERLTASRADAVDTAAADLRRLERDLHDGAQARLVALGMSLRAAERMITVNPDAALALVAEAREASARALTELRELVRGVHPPVLADRGLADALRALALDGPLHVDTRIDLDGRPPAPVETACYFAVAELLANAAKHSGARQARIDASHSAGRLRIEVTDFGLGGANPAAGSGLAGVEKRLASFDGIMAISSPPGGPTIVVLEVPCVLSSPKTSIC